MTNQDRDADRLALADDLEAAAAMRSDSDAHLMVLASIALRAPRRDEPVACNIQIQAKAKGYDWTDIFPAQLQSMAAYGHEVRAIELAHPAASQGEADRFEATPAGVINWKAEAERANRLLAAEQYRNAVDRVNRSTDREIGALTSPAPSRPAAQPGVREVLEPFVKAARIIAKRPQDYADRIVTIGGLSEPADLHKRHFADLLAAIAPASANEVKSSAPAPNGSLPSGESDPSVTLDRAGAEAMKQIKSVCEDNKPDFCNHKMALSFVMDIAERYLSGANEVKP